MGCKLYNSQKLGGLNLVNIEPQVPTGRATNKFTYISANERTY